MLRYPLKRYILVSLTRPREFFWFGKSVSYRHGVFTPVACRIQTLPVPFRFRSQVHHTGFEHSYITYVYLGIASIPNLLW